MDFPFSLTSNVNINKCVSTLVPISLFFIRSFLSNLSEVCIQTGNWMCNLQPWQNSWNNLKNNLILSFRRGLSLEWLCHSQYRKENNSYQIEERRSINDVLCLNIICFPSMWECTGSSTKLTCYGLSHVLLQISEISISIIIPSVSSNFNNTSISKSSVG